MSGKGGQNDEPMRIEFGRDVMNRLNSIVHKLVVFVGGAALMVMMLHITAEVVFRSLFGFTIPGTLEFVSFYYMVFGVFAGLAIVALLNEHVVVEVFLNWLPRRTLSIFDAAGALLGAAYAGFLAYGAWLQAQSSTKFDEMMPVRGFDMPIWPSRWVAVAGLIVIAFAGLGHAVRFLRKRGEQDT